MHIEQSARDGCIVLTLTGDLDVAAAPLVQRALLRCLARQPDAVICDTLDQAVAQAHSRPSFLRERLRLVPTLDAIATARWFVADVCQRWQLDALTETAQPLAGELVTDAVLYEPNGVELIELRVELRAVGLLVAVQSGDQQPASAGAGGNPDDNPLPGSGLDMVQRATPAWGVRRQADGSRVVWGILRRSRAQCA
jgi:hypothetical protein